MTNSESSEDLPLAARATSGRGGTRTPQYKQSESEMDGSSEADESDSDAPPKKPKAKPPPRSGVPSFSAPRTTIAADPRPAFGHQDGVHEFGFSVNHMLICRGKAARRTWFK